MEMIISQYLKEQLVKGNMRGRIKHGYISFNAVTFRMDKDGKFVTTFMIDNNPIYTLTEYVHFNSGDLLTLNLSEGSKMRIKIT